MTEAVEFLHPIQKKTVSELVQAGAGLRTARHAGRRHKSLEAFLETYTLDPVAATYDTSPKARTC